MIIRRHKCLPQRREEIVEHIRNGNNSLASSFISAGELINPNPSFPDICDMIIKNEW